MSLTISKVAARTGLSADTLRYYERIGLLPAPARTAGGRRAFGASDLSRLRFIGRAKSIGFSLAEIAELLKFRENPAGSSAGVRKLAAEKHRQVERHLRELRTVENELALLLDICHGDAERCPILNRLEDGTTTSNRSTAGKGPENR